MGKYLHTLDEYYSNYQNRSFIESLLLNPNISRWDIFFFILFFVFMTILRFLVVGIHNDIVEKSTILSKLPKKCLLDRFMHFYWFYLILRMTRVFIIKTMRNESIEDIRSEDEGEKQSVEKVPKKGS
ncbi:translocation associated membrane protein, putative [Plasmodium ovale wallikeri]|uniref:Translocation associated membrane protein, putative n=1 Tax=Plasmodium ovale wallikeri TaxID=864142 RepID=A0A1A8ZRY9_PLAOA|nr:translocation associated membrane protein, putative [Plasmodium ovale wallikeri]